MNEGRDDVETDADVADTAIKVGLLGFLVFMLLGAFLTESGLYPEAWRISLYLIVGMALVGCLWLLWKSPTIPE